MFRRLSSMPGAAGEMLAAVESVSGISRTDLRYRLAGPGFGVLLPKQPRPAMEACADELGDFGMPAAVVAKSELSGARLPAQARRVNLEKGFIEFQTAEEEPILRVDNTSQILIIVTDLSGQAVKQILTTIAYTSQLQEFPFAEILKKLSMARGAALVYDMGKEPAEGVFIDSGAFTYSGLNEALTPSVALNFRVMIDEAMRLAQTSATDHYFGIAALPGAKPDWKSTETAVKRRLAVYARYMMSASRKGLFQLPAGDAQSPRGSAEPASETAKSRGGENTTDTRGGIDQLEPPPAVQDRTLLGGLLSGSFGEVTGALIALGAILFFSASGVESLYAHPRLWQSVMGVLIALGGAGLFCYALLLLYYKRMVENTPTSNVRSLSMGMAELTGRARPYYDLRTAHTLTPCIFYECRYYNYKRSRDTSKWRLTRTVSSGKLAFYLEDETGRVLVNPGGAYYSITRTSQTIHGRFIPSLAIQLEDPNMRVTEDLIPIGAKIYVLGSAHLQRQGKKHGERLVERLRSLKADKARMARYDQNGDGRIDDREWEAARADVEQQVYAESLASHKGAQETVVVEKPRFGLLPFIVADSETGLLRKLAFRTWLFLACGAVACGCGIGMLV